MRPSFSLKLFLIVIPLTFWGCIKMGPEYKRPELNISVPANFQHAYGESGTRADSTRWWTEFEDPELNRVIDEVLENNLDIKRAIASIAEVSSRFVQTRADRFPSLDVEAQGLRQSQTIGGRSGVETDKFTLSLPASFEIDLWGRLARSEEAAMADLLGAEENRRTVIQTVVAESIVLYFQIVFLEERIQVALESIQNYRHSLDLVERRYNRGISTILDLRQARRTLAQGESLLPTLRQEFGVAQHKLAVLMGRYPEFRPSVVRGKGYFRLMLPVPSGLPSELLLNRPDIRRAEEKLKALNALVGAAEANRFPKIALTGSFGYSSEELGDLLRPESEIWTLAFGVAQPIFDAGRLKAGQKGAEARYQQGVAEYAKTILTAFSEVESALLTRREQLEKRSRLLKFLEEARATQKVAENRYGRGLVDYLTVLEAQQTRFKAEDSLLLVDLAIMSNRVSLYRALGGGWGEIGGQPPAG